MNLTPQQIDAVTTEGRALLVEAGAGTGKTAVLVQRFVHLLDRHPEWPIDSIVAVTFTEKATREMRSRIRADIEARAAAGGPNSLWEARRRDLDRLAVSTIHGLCARILRENPIAAAIDPRFTVLEEQDTALLREESVRRVVAELASEQRPTAPGQRDPLELLALFETNDLREQMIRLLNQRGTAERLFAQLPGSADLMARWREKVREMQAAIWAEHLAEHEEAAEGLAELANLVVEHPEDKLAEHVGYAQEGCALADCGDICGAATAFARIKVNAGRAASFGGADRLNEVKGWLKAVRALGESLTKRGYCEPVGENDEAAADALQCWRAFWELVTHVYDGMKADLRALDFDDLERLAWRLLTARPRDERVQATVHGINHLMVDEFQDVNEMQGEILRGLADLGAAGRFFAVGDAKQSIYRFRQAQVKVFNAAARDILAQTGHGPLPLNRSFRTHAALLNALNVAFEGILAPAGAEHADFEARPGALDPERAAPAPCEAAPAAVEILALTPGPADETRRDEAALLARRLRELVGQRMPVWDKEQRVLRPVTFGDMAILFRATTSLPIYEDVFKAAGLPYVTVSGRGYYDRPEVRDLTALLGWLSNPADDLSAATVLRSPMFSLSDESLYRLRWFGADGARPRDPIPFAAALDAARTAHGECPQATEIAFAAETMAGLRAATGRTDVWMLLRQALDLTGYEATLALADEEAARNGGGGRGRANVAKFLQLARDRGGADLSRFLQSVQDLRAREAREGEALPDQPQAGAVQLMSVHAAKGLEFPVVALADLGRTPRGGNGARILHDPMYGLACQVRGADGDWIKPASFRWAEWLDARMEQAENKRLLYVACTRAADLLILSGNPKAEDCWLRQLAEAWEVGVSRSDDGLDVGEELYERPDYAIRVVRPGRPPDEDERESVSSVRSGGSGLRVDTMPPLAQPLPPRLARWPVAVTHTPTAHRSEPDEPPTLRPVVRGARDDAGPRRPWRFLVGNLAHRALADWDCLGRPEPQLRDWLIRRARRAGLSEQRDVTSAVDAVARQLRDLRVAPLYGEICDALERHAEVPLSICAGGPGGDGRVLHGVLDLLYRDRAGQWRLLDWKTERVRAGQSLEDAAAGETVRQLAVYRQAVERILGITTVAEVCFLSAGALVHRPEPGALAEAWDRLVVEETIAEA